MTTVQHRAYVSSTNEEHMTSNYGNHSSTENIHILVVSKQTYRLSPFRFVGGTIHAAPVDHLRQKYINSLNENI